MLDSISVGSPIRGVAVAILCAYLIGHSLSALHGWTRRGQPASPGFSQALILGGVVGAMIVIAVGNSLARGVGIFGALALIRFRTNLRDPLDMIFIFASFAGGIAAGAGNLAAGFVGTGVFAAVMLATRAVGATRDAREAELRVRLVGPGTEEEVRASLEAHVASFALLKRRLIAAGKHEAEQRMTYRILLADPADEAGLMQALAALPGVSEASVTLDGVSAAGGDDD